MQYSINLIPQTMKKALLLLLAILLGFNTLNSSAQSLLTVHDGVDQCGYVPLYGFYADAYLKSEFIIPASDISNMQGTNITSLTFYTTQENISWGAASFVVFLDTVAETTLNSFLVNAPGTPIVYSGSLSVTNHEMEIVLNQPFGYNGGNLLVGIYCTSPGDYVASTWMGEDVDGASVQGYSYSSLNSVNPTQRNFIPKTTFTYLDPSTSCFAPINPTISNTATTSATMSWTSGEGQNTWEVYCDTGTVDLSQVTWTTVSDTFYTFTGLNANTQYTAYVRTACGTQTSTVRSVSFFTANNPINVPFVCTFEEDSLNSFWTIKNGIQTNQWYIGTAVNNTPGGNKALYISDNNGTSNTYTNNAESSVWAYLDVNFPAGNEFLLSFDWRAQGEGTMPYIYDYLRVYIGQPYNVTPGSIPSSSYITTLETFNLQDSWQTANIVLSGSYANSTQRIYFLWNNDYSDGNNPPAAIDNLSITGVSCVRPNDVTVNNINPTFITVDLTPASGIVAGWEILCTDGNNSTVTVSTTNATGTLVSNLTPATIYNIYARTICGEGDTSVWTEPVSFMTACATISTMPQLWDFEGDNLGGTSSYPLPVCWNRLSDNNYPSVSYSSSYYDYSKVLSTGSNPTNQIAILPEINTSMLPINSLTVSFDAFYYAYLDLESAMIEVGVMTDPTDSTTFTTVGTVSLDNGLSDLEQEFLIPLTNYTGNGSHIALRFNANSASSSAFIYVNDVTLDFTPSCPRPEQVAITQKGSNYVMLSWSSDETPFNVYYKPADSSDYILANPSPIVNTQYTLTGLTENTTYDLYVTNVCTDQTETPSRPISFTTLCTAIPVTHDSPFFENFASLTSGIPDCWINEDGTTTTDSYKWNYYNDDGVACVRFNSYNNPEHRTNMLKTPALDLTSLTNPELTITYKNPQGGDFSIFFSTDGGATYTTAIATDLTNTAEWTEADYLLPANADNVTIVFQGTSNYGYGDAYIYLSEVWVEEMFVCSRPENFTAVNTTEHNTVTLGWHETGSASSWDVAYGPTGFNADSMATMTHVTDTFATITGLTDLQYYDFYVRAACEDGEHSHWTGPIVAAPGCFTFGINGSSSITSCGIQIFDNGGPNDNYSAYCDYTLTIYPTDPDSVVSVTGNLSSELNFDYLYIYNGSSAVGNPLATLNGRQENFGPYTSTSGPLTLRFTSDQSIQDSGFVVIASCVAAPECLAPYDLSVNPSAHEALITWSAQAGAVVELYYKKHNDNDYTVVTASQFTTENSYLLTNLLSATEYDVYVATICSNDTMASEVLPFSTTCAIISDYPFVEDFSETSPSLSCWATLDANNDQKTFSYYSFYECMYYTYHTQHTANDWLLSPTFVLNGEQIAEFDYWTQPGYEEKFQVFAMTTETEIALTPVIAVQDQNHQTITIDLSNLSGEYVIGIHCVSEPNMYNLYIDNFKVQNVTAPELTVNPTFMHFHSNVGVATTAKIAMVSGISLTNAITATTTAPFELSTDGTNFSTSVTLPVSTMVTNDSLYVRYNPTVAGNHNGAVNLTSDTISAAITLNGRAADCENITLPYFEDFNSYNDGISANYNCPEGYPDGDMPLCWSFLNRSTSTTTYPMVFVSYYPDYSVNGNCVFFRSSSTTPAYAILPYFQHDIHNLQLSFSYRNEGTTDYNGILSVGYMTDINDANSFTEIASFPRVIFMTEDTVTFNTVPSTVTNAYIAFKYTGGTANNFYLSIDDVLVEALPVDPTVITEAASDITPSSARMNATINNPDNVTVTSCGFVWKAVDDTDYITYILPSVSTNMSTLLTGLTENTTYTYKAFIAYNGNTIYGDDVTFTTEIEPCEEPTDLQLNNITANSAIMTWNAGDDETTWEVGYKLATSSQWQEALVTTTSYTLEDLTPSSTYNVRVKAICGEENESNFVTSSFTTGVGINNLALSQSISLMPNPADHYIELSINSTVEVKEAVVFNAFGQMIQTVQLTDNHARIDLSNMASGMYFVRVSGDTATATKKFIKK
jgi:hypothetical protein